MNDYRHPDDVTRARERLVAIHRRLKVGDAVVKAALAADFGVSDKTIQRDLDELRALRAPLEYDRSRRGYVYTDPSFSLDEPKLSADEQFALMVAETALAQYEGTDLHERLARAFERIGARLPEDMRARHAIVARALHFGGLPAPAIDPVVWEQLLVAIQRREVVKVDYAALGEERAATRTLHPYQLLARDRDWFLVARHVRRRRELLYYLPRITSVRPTGETFTPSRAFDVDGFHGRSFNAMQGPGDPVDVTLRFPPEHAALAAERPWSRDQRTEEQDDGSVTVTFPSAALFEVQRQVLRYEGRVEVVEPRELREGVARTAEEIARVHGG